MSTELETLILRYLDGTVGGDDLRYLDQQLQADAGARDALVTAAAQDIQLREVFAVESAPHDTGLAFGTHRSLRILAAAAALAIIAGGVFRLATRYPEPEVSGSCNVAGGGQVRRGSVITTDGSGLGAITLGGYCRVEMGVASTLRVEGTRYAEQIVLERGEVLCSADRGVGEFTVQTDVGAVSVKGTRFCVRMADKKGEKDMLDKRMVVGVLAGTVLVSGAWGESTLRAGQEAVLPPPGAAIGSIVDRLDLPEETQRKLDRVLSPAYATQRRNAYRTEVRGRLFDAARRKLQAAMPAVMPTKVGPKVRAVRAKKRGGPPSATDIALIRMASQKRARSVLMAELHKTADTLADEAAADDRLIAWLLATQVRSNLPGAQVAAFDESVNAAGISDTEAQYVARAEAAIAAATAAYDPDLSGILDPETGRVIVSAEDLGIPLQDDALAKRVSEVLGNVLADLDVAAGQMETIAPVLTDAAIQVARLNYCTDVRTRVFEAARKTLASELPQKMPAIVQAKVTAIRTRVQAGGPPSAADIARIQHAAMTRIRGAMEQSLHNTADAVAAAAVRDERLVAAVVAKSVRKKLPAGKVDAFDAALAKAGLTGDESRSLAEAEQRIKSAIESFDPDLAGIVSPVTGKVIVKE